MTDTNTTAEMPEEIKKAFEYGHAKRAARIQRIMERVGMADSTSLYLALAQFEIEIVIGIREAVKEILDGR